MHGHFASPEPVAPIMLISGSFFCSSVKKNPPFGPRDEDIIPASTILRSAFERWCLETPAAPAMRSAVMGEPERATALAAWRASDEHSDMLRTFVGTPVSFNRIMVLQYYYFENCKGFFSPCGIFSARKERGRPLGESAALARRAERRRGRRKGDGAKCRRAAEVFWARLGIFVF